jgi:uncharacterized protein (TIGR02145 family)
MNNVKLSLFLFLVSFAILGCSGDSNMPCVSCGDSPGGSAYCFRYIGGGYSCEYMNVSSCNGTNYGSDHTCGNYGSQLPSSSSQVPVPPSYPSSSSRQSGVIHGTPVTYGGEAYNTVKIGSQTWMARNLNYDVPGNDSDVCYGNDAENCVKYGRLYDWATAMALPGCGYGTSCASQIQAKHKGICPTNWHIPSDDEWSTLFDYVGSPVGTRLKASTGWNPYDGVPAGTDEFGFSALPGGYGNSAGSFDNAGNYGYWWSATEGNGYYAYYRYMDYLNEHALWSYNDKSLLFSVRCLQD